MRIVGIAVAVGLLAGCVKDVKQDVDHEEGGGVRAVYAPDSAEPCESQLPFPNDLARNPAGGLNIPICPDDSADAAALKVGLRTLDGFSINGPVYFEVTGPIDPTSLADAVTFIATPAGTPVSFTPVFDPTSRRAVLLPSTPLDESTTYVVFVTDALTDVDGNPVSADQIFTFAKSTAPLINDRGFSRFPALSDQDANGLEGLRQGLTPMFDAIEATGTAREDVILAWSFTTQSVHGTMTSLFGAAMQLGGATVTHETSGAAADHPLVIAVGLDVPALCDIHTGHMVTRSFLTQDNVFSSEPSTASVDYMLITPNEGGCGTWSGTKVAVLAHALGRCKNDALALANALASIGYATLSFDAPRHGGRADVNLGDADIDGCADQPELPFMVAGNTFTVRDSVSQWAIDMAQVAELASVHSLLFAGIAEPATPPTPDIVFVGHSLGGIAALLGATLTDTVRAVATNATSGEWGTMLEPALRARIAAQVEAGGLPRGAPNFNSVVAGLVAENLPVLRWILEPADALYAPRYLSSGVEVLTQVVSNEGLVDDASLHAAETQALLAQVLGQNLTQVTFEMTFDPGTGEVAVCDSGTAAVGALLQPCTSDPVLVGPATLKTGGMQRQITRFFFDGTVCSPDYLTPCP